jgi:hypothetical protein
MLYSTYLIIKIYKRFKGIVSCNKMTFGRFHFIAGNFLIIRCRILNFKNFDFILLVKKYSVCRFVPIPVRVLDKFPHNERFFSPYGTYLLPCGKSFNQSINNLSLASSRTGRIADFCLCFASMSLNLPHSERFLQYGEKNLSPLPDFLCEIIWHLYFGLLEQIVNADKQLKKFLFFSFNPHQ